MTGEPTAAADPAPGPSTGGAAAAHPGRHADAATTGAAPPAPATPKHPALLRRAMIAVVAVVLLCVPFVVFTLINHQVAVSSWAVFAGLTGLMNYIHGGRAIGYLTVGLMAALAPISVVVGAVPITGAALMALMCGGLGVSALFGLQQSMMLIPLYLSLEMIAPPAWGDAPVDRGSTSYLLWTMLIWGGGALWAVLVFPPLLRKMKPVPREPNTRGDTIVYAATLTVLCTLSTLAVLIWWPGSNGAWLIVTLLVITQAGARSPVKRTVQRIVGTVIGVVAAAVLAAPWTGETVLIGIGLVLLVIALTIRIGPNFWLFTAVITPAFVLFTSVSSDVATSAEQRVVDTLVGAALVLLASGITVLWARQQQAHGAALPDAGGHHRQAVTT